jgi:hypothetical protein
MITEVAVMAAKLNLQFLASPNNGSRDAEWAWDHVYPLAHSLLTCRASVEITENRSVIKEFCRLSLCIYLTNARRMFTLASMVLDTYLEQLLALLQHVTPLKYQAEFEDFKVWTMVHGAMTANGQIRLAFLDMLRSTVNGLEIQTHDALELRMKSLIWIEQVDGIRFQSLRQELWNSLK